MMLRCMVAILDNFERFLLVAATLILIYVAFYNPLSDNTRQTDPGAMYVSVTCTQDGRGVARCCDRNTGKCWTIYTNPSNT